MYSISMQLLKQNHIKYGLIMAALTALCLMFMEITGQNESFDMNSPFQLFYTFLAPAIVWYFGIRARKKSLKGKMTFKAGLKEGCKISLVYGIVSPFIFLMYYVLINPTILDSVRTMYGLGNASDTVVIVVDMFIQFVSAIIFGTIYAAIISLFLKSKS